MRIAFITSSYPRFSGDGIGQFVKSIAESMAKKGHNIQIVAPYDVEVNSNLTGEIIIHRFRYIWPTRLHILGHARSLKADVKIRLLVFPLLPFFTLAAISKLWKTTRDQKSHVIYAHWVLPNGVIAAVVSYFRRIPFILSLHGSDIYVSKKNKPYGILARWVFNRASGITSCSPNLREEAIKLGAKHDIKLIPWGADPTKFYPSRDVEDDIRKLLHIPEHKIIIASIGRFVYKKGFGKLIDSWNKIADKNPSAVLVIGGGGPLLYELKEKTKRLNISERVIFPGQISWNLLPDFMSLADIFVIPSIQDDYGNIDGLPTVIFEAMGSGIPVIASRIAGIPLVIQHRENGILFPPGNINTLSNEIQFLLKTPSERERLGKAAHISIKTTYNWRIVTEEIINLIESII